MIDYKEKARDHLRRNGDKAIVDVVADLLSQSSSSSDLDKLIYRIKARKLEAENQKLIDLLSAVHMHFSGDNTSSKAPGPGHSHSVAGVWDENGMACEWCNVWKKVNEIVREKTP